MANKHVTTQKGLALFAKQQAGGALPNITRVVAGAGYIDPALLDQQTEVLEPIAGMEVGNRQLVDGKIVRLPVQLSNMHLTDTAMIRQIGAYSQDPDEGEILYQIVQYEYPVPLPTYAANNGGVILFEPELDLMFSNGELAEIPSTPEFLVTQQYLVEHYYIQSQVDALLSNKANESEVEMYDFQLAAGFIGTLKYGKRFGIILLDGDVGSPTATFTPGTRYTLGVLPEGFRPNIATFIPSIFRSSLGAESGMAGRLTISKSTGAVELVVPLGLPSSHNVATINGFLVAQRQ